MKISPINRKVTATYSHDEVAGLYTFSLLEKGGPVIIAKSIDEGKKKLEEALSFTAAIRNLQYFDDISISNRAEFIRSNIGDKRNEVEYVPLEVA